jgi:lipoprotein-anchoring transpeptidase ErfK/SrfK
LETAAAPKAAEPEATTERPAPGDSPSLRADGSASSSEPAVAADEASAQYATPAVAKYAFEQAWRKAELQIGDGQLARALLTLTVFYRNRELDESSQKKLHERLDQLAGTVIYSTRHLLEDPYKVLRGETLEEIAQRYKLPPRLLQNINGLQDPSLVLPGTELKVLRGPFRAEVDTARGELTLFLGGLYAGRFSIQTGNDPPPRPGKYDVLDIQPGHTYISAAGQTIPAGSPANPYGQWWIDLGGDVCIHGAPDAGAAPGSGCVALSPRDAGDVAAILSVGSKVIIR